MLINDSGDDDSFDQIFGKQMDFEEQSEFFFLLFLYLFIYDFSFVFFLYKMLKINHILFFIHI